MKKEYIILLAVIVLLSGYLFFHKENKDHSDLPEFQPLDTAGISSIIIQKSGKTIRFDQKNNAWTVTENHYPADKSLVEAMLDTAKTFKLTALVSREADVNRYELDRENRIQVSMLQGEKIRFKCIVGKAAPTFNHTFVMVGKDKNIYHARGNFRNDFDKDVQAFRDKKVFEVSAPAVTAIQVVKGDRSRTLMLEQAPPVEKDNGKKDKAVKTWLSAGGKPEAPETVESFLSAFSYLTCTRYADDRQKKDFQDVRPQYSLKINTQEEIVLNLYKIKDSEEFYGISSKNEYVFVFSKFDAGQLTGSMDRFLGIEKE